MTKTVRLISESTGGEITQYTKKGGNLYLEGIFSRVNIVNANGHYYPKEVMEESVRRYVETYVQQNRALGELNHPDHLMVDPKEACIMVEELDFDGDAIVGRAKVIDDLPNGKIVRSLIDAGVKLGVSTRGGGNIVEDKDLGAGRIDDGFELVAIDVVTDPAVPDAFVSGVYQSRSFVFDNGVFKYAQEQMARRNDGVDVVEAIMEMVRNK